MELLCLIEEMQTEDYKYKMKRESLKNYCGFELTDFQLDVLMAENVFNSQTIYARQVRRMGTSTALLLKVYQTIFDDNNTNDKRIISRTNNQSTSLKDKMMNIIGQAGMVNNIRRHNRHLIQFNFGTTIYFDNRNANNLIGTETGPEIFFDDYDVNDSTNNQEFNSILRALFPTHVHYFLAGEENYMRSNLENILN